MVGSAMLCVSVRIVVVCVVDCVHVVVCVVVVVSVIINVCDGLGVCGFTITTVIIVGGCCHC